MKREMVKAMAEKVPRMVMTLLICGRDGITGGWNLMVQSYGNSVLTCQTQSRHHSHDRSVAAGKQTVASHAHATHRVILSFLYGRLELINVLHTQMQGQGV
jgi:hypothetical protein